MTVDSSPLLGGITAIAPAVVFFIDLSLTYYISQILVICKDMFAAGFGAEKRLSLLWVTPYETIPSEKSIIYVRVTR